MAKTNRLNNKQYSKIATWKLVIHLTRRTRGFMPRSDNRLTSSGILLSYMKIVINQCYGGFGLSEEAVLLYGKKKGLNIIVVRDKIMKGLRHYYLDEVKDGNYFHENYIERNDPALVEVVNELGKKADGYRAELKIVEIPDDVKWTIEEYNGKEWVAEDHPTWS